MLVEVNESVWYHTLAFVWRRLAYRVPLSSGLISDSQGQILAWVFRFKTLQRRCLFARKGTCKALASTHMCVCVRACV